MTNPMGFNEYQRAALRTEAPVTDVVIARLGLFGPNLQHAVQLLQEHLSEVDWDGMKRAVFYGRGPVVDKYNNLQEEIKKMEPLPRLIFESFTRGSPRSFEEDVQRVVDANKGKTFSPTVFQKARVTHAILGKITELIELLDGVWAQEDLPDAVNVKEEVGDGWWYDALLLDAFGLTAADCAERNIAKLRTRYPEKFTEDRAVDRDLAAERSALSSVDSFYETPNEIGLREKEAEHE